MPSHCTNVTFPPVAVARPRIDTDRVEAFWVIEGPAEFELDGETAIVEAGAFVLVPGGVAHTFGATADAPARVLVLHAPALDAYFRELHELWSGDTPPEAGVELALMSAHGMQPAG